MSEIQPVNEPYARRENDVVVVYTIKEMFGQTTKSVGRIENLIAQLSEAVSRKADTTELDLLDARVTHFEKQEAGNMSLIEDYKATRDLVRSHETVLQRQDAVKASLKATWALVFGALAAIGTLISLAGRLSF